VRVAASFARRSGQDRVQPKRQRQAFHTRARKIVVAGFGFANPDPVRPDETVSTEYVSALSVSPCLMKRVLGSNGRLVILGSVIGSRNQFKRTAKPHLSVKTYHAECLISFTKMPVRPVRLDAQAPGLSVESIQLAIAEFHMLERFVSIVRSCLSSASFVMAVTVDPLSHVFLLTSIEGRKVTLAL
jgi:hypothetical protein